ncbi:hypothetical protein QBC46DRAFT_260666 [Diplogelasinospora grovesii]|uniref:SSCRP protein n=1 Tax=Diplogelasinospora grovesii TaxID=303347 RepID=A0AAN6S4U1_9PEZI|nr:hypothetical protein QBC46DRAFT_260666 [Diplogelasinospora grovesii]
MKFLLAILALAATALAEADRRPAAPAPCKPGTYACAVNPKTYGPGWQVCDVSGNWVYAGDCPPNAVCKFLPANGSPYCIPIQ